MDSISSGSISPGAISVSTTILGLRPKSDVVVDDVQETAKMIKTEAISADIFMSVLFFVNLQSKSD